MKQQGDFDRAVFHYQQALTIQPDYADAHNNLGNVLRHQGKVDEAMARFDRALEIQPDFAQAHYDRTALKTFRPGDPDLARLEELAADPARLDDNRMVYIHFGLGKALEDVGQYDRAFEQWLKGNAIQRKMIRYDEAAELQNFRLAAGFFGQEFYEKFPQAGDPSPAPIFILGMPRSGTTLVEQILASHPLVYGAGELPALGQVACAISNTAGQAIPFPLYLRSPKPETLRRLGPGLSLEPAAAAGRQDADHRQDAGQFPVHRPDSLDSAQCQDHPHGPRPGRHLRFLLFAIVHGRAGIHLRFGRAGAAIAGTTTS